MSMTPKLLTLRGQTMSMMEWSLRPGAATYSTIVNRLIAGWAPEDAVFTRSKKGRSPMYGPKQRKVRVRLTGVNRPSRAMTERHHRPELNLAPNPRVANPHPPTWGGYSSWPLEALELLRRCA